LDGTSADGKALESEAAEDTSADETRRDNFNLGTAGTLVMSSVGAGRKGCRCISVACMNASSSSNNGEFVRRCGRPQSPSHSVVPSGEAKHMQTRCARSAIGSFPSCIHSAKNCSICDSSCEKPHSPLQLRSPEGNA
jgi:hypothetical protein